MSGPRIIKNPIKHHKYNQYDKLLFILKGEQQEDRTNKLPLVCLHRTINPTIKGHEKMSKLSMTQWSISISDHKYTMSGTVITMWTLYRAVTNIITSEAILI